MIYAPSFRHLTNHSQSKITVREGLDNAGRISTEEQLRKLEEILAGLTSYISMKICYPYGHKGLINLY
jgi:hypothetical protein